MAVMISSAAQHGESDPGKSPFPILLILLAAMAVRVVGLWFGLPHPACRPDESTLLDAAINVARGDPNPHFFYYPSFFIYIVAALLKARDLFLVLLHLPYAPLDSIAIDQYPPSLFLIMRGLSAAFGTATVYVVYRIALRIWDRRTGFLAAFFMALCYLHVRDSHFGTTDVAATFFTLCAVLAGIKVMDRGLPRDYVTAGLLLGLATATKYGAVFAALPLLFAHGCRRQAGGDSAGRLKIDPKLILAGVCFAGAFLAVCPYSLLDFGTFRSHFISEMSHLARGHAPFNDILNLGRGWWYHLTFTLPLGAGWPMLFGGIAGLALLTRSRPRRGAFLLLYPLIYYLVSGKGYTVFVRYMIPVLPFLCLGSAYAVIQLADRMGAERKRRMALVCLSGAFLLQPVANVVMFDALLCRTDNRLLVANWLKENVSPEKTLVQTGLAHGQVILPPGFAGFRTRDAAEGLPNYLLVQDHPLPSSGLSPAMKELIPSSYKPVKFFEATSFSRKRNKYDLLDAFYLPYSGFHGVRRPGPNFILYERNTGS